MQASIKNQSHESKTSSPEEREHPGFPDADVSHSVSRREKTSEKTLLKNETEYLSREYITYRCEKEGIILSCSTTNGSSPSKKTKEVLELLKKLCYKYEKQYEGKLKVCCDKLQSSKSNASRNFFDVAKELFSQNIKWEHIIVLIAFSGRLAIDYMLRDMIDYIECLIGWLSVFLLDRLGEWILTHDGWVSLGGRVCVCLGGRVCVCLIIRGM